MKKNLLLLTLLAVIFSCKKSDFVEKNQTYSTTITDDYQIKFAKILSKAVEEEPELRKLIKEESLKMFDNDYDVLYQLIKDKEINGTPISEILCKYSTSKDEFLKIEENLPLLTIFVPSLPNFNAENWNANNEIPKVAVRLSNNNNTPVYDAYGTEEIINVGYIPSFPVIVVKQNERVVVNNTIKGVKNGNIGNFIFLDDSFNKNLNKVKSNTKTITASTDPACIRAYNLGMGWHRDHIYYGLTPSNTTGAYRNNYSEYITSFKLNSIEKFTDISDQGNDPQKDLHHKYNPEIDKTVFYDWTDGFFEFRFEILINAKNGTGSTITKYITINKDDLLKYEYKKHTFWFYKQVIVGLKEYNPNLELIPWDLKQYGMAWKFNISEVDPSEEDTYTTEITSTFATNFNIDTSIKKVGLKFGKSQSNTHKSTLVRNRKLESDELGEAILTFDQPVITGYSSGNYNKRSISTGLCTIVVEPKRNY